MTVLARPIALAAAAWLLAGCSTVSQVLPTKAQVDIAQPTYALPQAAPPQALNNGAIYQASQYRPLFEDHRARLVGDTLTVQIVEKVSASQKSNSTVDKKGSVAGSISAIPFLNATQIAKAKLNANASSDNSFEGKGATDTSNDFSGTITAVVTGVLANGHLLIAGEKQIGVNANVDVLRFSGQVDPRAIQPGNSVASAQIANVRIEHKGRGQAADAQGIGWLARFFLNVLPV